MTSVYNIQEEKRENVSKLDKQRCHELSLSLSLILHHLSIIPQFSGAPDGVEGAQRPGVIRFLVCWHKRLSALAVTLQ